MTARARDGVAWAGRMLAALPLLLIAFGCLQPVGVGATFTLLMPAVVVTALLCAALGAWAGLLGVVGAAAGGLVLGATVEPMVLASIAGLLAACTWVACLLVASSRPALAVVPSALALVVVLLIGLASTAGSLLLAAGVTVSLALLLFVVGSWTGAGEGASAAVVPTGRAVVWSGAALLLAGLLAFVAGGVADALMTEPPRQVTVSAQRPSPPPPLLGDLRDPLTQATRWQMLPAEGDREVLTLLPPARPVRSIWVALADYTGTGWAPPVYYKALDGTVPPDPLGTPTKVSNGSVRFEVGAGLPGAWVPVPQRVRQVVGGSGLRVAVTSGTVVSPIIPIGQRFEARYAVPVASDAQLGSATAAVAPRTDPSRRLPGALPPEMAALADRVAQAAGPSAWSRLNALSASLRGPALQPAVPSDLPAQGPGRSLDDYELVLVNRVGFQEQYAAIFALIARSWGIPTRVSVGFLPVVNEGGSIVHGSDASVWPEAALDGLGWVAFQASPQDRIAGRPAVVRPARPKAATASPSPGAASGGSSGSATTAGSATEAAGDGFDGHLDASRTLPRVLSLAVVVLLWLGFVALVRRRARWRLRRGDPAARVRGAWTWSRRILAASGLPLPPGASPDRVADPRDPVGDDLPPQVGEPLRALAVQVAPVLYAPGGTVAPESAESAWRLADEVEHACVRALPTRARLRRWLVPGGGAGPEWEESAPAGTLAGTVEGRAPRDS